MAKKRMRSMCLWCGKDHKGKAPKVCKAKSTLMSAVCQKIEPWKAMMVLESQGTDGLEALAHELGIKAAS